MNASVETRLEFAKNLVSQLSDREGIAAIFIGGSVARGYADESSDLELCFLWQQNPTDVARKRIIQDFQGDQFNSFESWSEDIHQLEDDIYVDGFQIDMWHNTVTNDQKYLDLVLNEFDTNTNRLNFLEVVQSSISLYDPQAILANWKKRVANFPDGLQKKIIETHMQYFGVNNVTLHLSRQDMPIFYYTIMGLQKRIFLSLLALNKMYFPTYKRALASLEKMSIRPNNIMNIFKNSFIENPEQCWQMHEKLMLDTLDLVDQHCPAVDTNAVREDFYQSRKLNNGPPLKKELI